MFTPNRRRATTAHGGDSGWRFRPPVRGPRVSTCRVVFGDDAFGSNGDELYEADDEFVLTVDTPGFEREEIGLAWHDGRPNVAAEHVDEARVRKKTYHRAFGLPKPVDEDAITATYRNGVLEVTLPMWAESTTHRTAIPIEG